MTKASRYIQCALVFIDPNTVEHVLNGYEVGGKKCYDRNFLLVNKLHDFTGMHDLSGNFRYDEFFAKTHARLMY